MLLMLSAGAAAALDNDRITPSVSVRRTWDDNIFRLSRDANTQVAIGSGQRGDAFTTTNVGLAFDIPWARQRFQASADVTKNAYDVFTSRDYVGNSGRATWLWQLGNLWSGQVGASTSSSLASTSNFQGNVPNPITLSSAFFSGAWQFAPSWRLGAGLASTQQRNGASTLKANDVTTDSTDFSLTYVSGAGNSIAASTRIEEANYPNQQLVSGVAVDNAYTQTSNGVSGDWRYSANSRFNARLDQVDRKYKQLASRKYAGKTWRVGYDWTPAGKSTASLSAFRDINQTEEVRTSLIVATGISLRLSYSISGKLSLSGTLDLSSRDYLGDAAQTLGSTATRRDISRTAGLTLAYQITRRGSITLGVLRDTRASNFTGLDYEATNVNVGAQIAF
jgi:exopolysaccharide biosynthesis operon protein EpsL